MRLSSNQSRVAFDIVAFAFAAIVTLGIVYAFNGVVHTVLLVTPVLGLLANYLVGINSRLRVASGYDKAIALTVSSGLVCVFILYATHDVRVAILWLALAWPSLVLPRVFLNLNRRTKLTAVGKTLAGALKDRGPVLVVGGAGYIGSHVVSELIREGSAVRVLDRLFYGSDSLKEFMGHPNFELIDGDVTDIGKLVAAVDGASAIVHLAGIVGDPACAVDDRYTRHCNIIATRMLKEVGQAYGVQRFIFASSCSVYGATEEFVDETSPLNPVSLYARTKIEGEHELLDVMRDDICITVLRFATVFGHSRRPRFDLVANLFTAQAFIDGKITVHGGAQARPFVHVFDLARSVLAVLKANPVTVQGQVFNVGDDRLNTTVGELAEVVRSVVSKIRPVETELHDDVIDKRNYNVSFAKIRSVLGFQASRLLEDGIQEMADHFQHGDYDHYRAAKYSNLEITKEVAVTFHDPLQSAKLYTPLSTDPTTPSTTVRAA